MKKFKLFLTILLGISVVFVSCKDPEPAHEHEFSDSWSKDGTYHWHAATCEHTTEVKGKAKHTFGNWTTTKEPTEEAEGSKERTCTVCGYTATEVIEKLAHTHKFATDWTKDETNHWHAAICEHTTEVSGKAAHSFGNWTTTKEATEEAEGTKERSCTVCGYTATEAIEKLAHTHKFATDWTKDETHHWYAAICGHDVVNEKAKHTFGDWTTTKEATEEAEGSKERSCTVCGYTTTEVIEKLDHTHKFSTDWSKDGTYHWYAATCEHTAEVSEKAEHTFGNWTTTKEATEEAEGSRERSCSVCGYTATEAIEKLAHTHKFATDWTKDETHHWYAAICEHTTEVSEKAAHSFGNWITTKAATEEAEGSRERSCTVCGYTATEAIEKLAHTHKFATDWTKDETNHWHAATCEHTDEKSGFTEHSFVNEVCTICEYSRIPEGFVFVKGTTINGNESWTPESGVFVSERKLTIPDLIVSDHEVTRGEYKAVMGIDPSTASANDKDGNELEGDAVLNNPVNYVNWYDALVYCNKLSMQENLTPCYTINSSTNPDDWGEVPTSRNSTWDAATCDFEANGYRLPTEAEWEWLARGGENYINAGSNIIDDVAWYKSNTNDTGTREVKTKAPNGYRLYDMSGNVYEWCWDWYGSISDSSAADGATSGSSRVLRGGSWYIGGYLCRVAYRNISSDPFSRYLSYGFRVVRSAN